MAASATVSQLPESRNFSIGRSGVLTLTGFGIKVRMQAGHLEIEDGIGDERRKIRIARVGHGLKRLVCISEDGFVTLNAVKWIADIGASFVMLNRNGKVLFVTGPTASSDARLRRAQALANTNGVALEISKGLIRRKLSAQEQLAREKLKDSKAADLIAANQSAVDEAQTIQALRLSESRAAHAYWSAWRNVPIIFPKNDIQRVPDHWRTFGTRISPLTGSPRRAVNPPNSMLNILYALLESEARLAAAAMGLDPGIGIMHVDTDARDSLAFDVMEPVRPLADSYVLDWITQEPMRRQWFSEQRDGTCRLVSSFAVRLAETACTWGRAVAPIAEWVARELWSTKTKRAHPRLPATRLTQTHKREAKGVSTDVSASKPPKPPRICLDCGAPIIYGKNFCSSCGVIVARDELMESAKRGRIAAQSPEAQTRRAETQRRNANAQLAWENSGQPKISDERYRNQIQPRLSRMTIPTIMSALNVCASYAADIRRGRRRPHPRHWETLVSIVAASL